MNQEIDFEKLTRFSADIRKETVKAIARAGSGHIGGAISLADVVAVLYGSVMRYDPKNPDWEDRDRFVLSKGHCAPGLYAALALSGFFPMEWLDTINKPKTNLPSHADMQKVPGVDMTTGSLGQGMSSACGIALGNKIQGRDAYTYCVVGDGELDEGEIWEACQTASHHELDHFVVFVDWNKKQLDGTLEEICKPLDIAEKFRAFGFDVRTVKGYDVKSIYEGIVEAKQVSGKPHVIILDTLKAIGIDFAEKVAFNHNMSYGMDKALAACEEIDRRLENGTYPGGDLI